MFTELIPADTVLPHKYSQEFANAEDNQPTVTINISQKFSEKYKSVALFNAPDLPPKPKGTLKLKLTLVVNREKELYIFLEGIRINYSKAYGPFNIK